MQGEMQDKCGVVGIHSVDDSKDVSSLIYYCLRPVTKMMTLCHPKQEVRLYLFIS